MVIKFQDSEHNFFAGLNDLRDAVHQVALDKGWWEPQEQIVALPLQGGPVTALVQRTFGDLVSLVHSEASEALEEHRAGHVPTEVYFTHPTGEVCHDQECVALERGLLDAEVKPEGVPIELADVIIRVLDICGFYGIDIEEALRLKTAHNATRPYRHGGKKL